MDVRRLAGEEEALFERAGQISPRRRMPGERVTVCAAHMGHPAPVRGDKRMQAAAHERSEQGGELIDRVREAGRRTHLLYCPGPFIAQEALDHGPAERADVVDAGAAVTRAPEHARLGGKRAIADDLKEELFVAPEREAGSGLP